MTKPALYIVVNNHFDLTWRRCWQRRFVFRGQEFVSYTDLQAYYLLDNLNLARQHPEYRFSAESVQVVRQVVERYPEILPDLQELARAGRFAVSGAGEAIVDANMIHGESLARNFIDGLLWVEAMFGQKTRLAVRNDAFGNSAQLPQILRGCEIGWATGMSYSTAEGRYWRGLDGSVILHSSLPMVALAGGVVKYPPCACCGGKGIDDTVVCPVCQGRGIDSTLLSELPEAIDTEAMGELPAGIVRSTPEEMLPNPQLLVWAERMREQYDVQFILEEDILPIIQPWLDLVDQPPEELVHPSVELNPNNSGVLVSRIRTKQIVRRQEHTMLAVEALHVMAALKGWPYPADEIRRVRQDQYFTMFHDAITATHIDAAYEELQDFWKHIDIGLDGIRASALAGLVRPDEAAVFSVINPTGQPLSAVCSTIIEGSAPARLVDETGADVPVLDSCPAGDGFVEVDFLIRDLPAFSARALRVLPAAAPAAALPASRETMIENSRFRIQADEHGLVSIYDKVLDREIAISDGLRPAELVLEHDEGSPWATLSDDMRRTPLAEQTHLEYIERTPVFQRMVFSFRAPWRLGYASNAMEARLSVRLVEGLEQVEFYLHTTWDCFNHRLRVAMPVPRGTARPRHLYEIPYGMLERRPYQPSFFWAGANGDWPALHWAGVETESASVALFNRGTPSYTVEAGSDSEILLMSLLRSPAIPTYLHEPQYYSMTDYDGMRDAGAHDFHFALRAYPQPFASSSVIADGEAYQSAAVVVDGRADLPALPVLENDTARISAIKWAEDGSGPVLRIVEVRGQGGEALVRLPEGLRRAEKVNLLERQGQELPVENGLVRLPLRAWEIATLKIAV